ncbi:MAG TPA: hypothetical protein VFX60_12455 [Micromonospora sp.]|nr:hypothetical protein [Micromonospora sp.]
MAGQVLELRVHGVANTAPASMLGIGPQPGDPPGGNARPRLVAGNQVTGFYRSSTADPDDPLMVEAYSWGQLTSGARTVKDLRRALWTLLLPFVLANLALQARPDIPADSREERWRSRPALAAWLVRLFCLSLTMTFAVAATGVGVDLVAWQCVDAACLAQIPGPWGFLGTGWWREGARALAVGLLAPLGVLALVGFLTWRTYHYEAELPVAPAGPDEATPLHNPLQDPTYWCGEGQVRRLAVLHLASAAAVAAAIPLGAVIAMDPPQGVRAVLVWPVVAVLAATVALSVAVLGHPYVTRRGGDTPLRPYGVGVAVLAAVGVIGTLAVLLLPDGPAGTPLADLRPPHGCAQDRSIAGCREDRSLPGYDAVIVWLGAFQILVLTALAVLTGTGRRTPDAGPHKPDEGPAGIAWGGSGPTVLAGLGWLLGLAYSAGVLYWVTDRLNHGATPSGRSAITLPVPVMWAGLAIIGVLAVAVVVAVRAWIVFVRLRRQSLAQLVPPGNLLSAHERRRARDVATYRALHHLIGEHSVRLVGHLAAAGAVLALAGMAAVVSGARPVSTDPEGFGLVVKAVADTGDTLAGWLPALVAGVGLLVYRNDAVRRSVGMLWDVATFWPRAAHPLAPPSYAERAVPQLQTRAIGLMALPDNDVRRPEAIILSGHSQGAVICAAVILQMPHQWHRRVWFFSYGCQLSYLYGRVFPAYFGPDRLPVVISTLTGPSGRVRWTNFWRETDPLGWPVNAGERELWVADPAALRPSGGEVADPPIHNHSGYPDAPEYQRERAEVVALATAAVPAPRHEP